MLFRNLKSGNLVEAANEAVIELMMLSPSYETVETTSAVPTPKVGKPAKKPGGKTAKTTK